MRRFVGAAAVALLCAGCGFTPILGRTPGYSVEFIAGNASTVVIDLAHGSDSELSAANTLATNRCTLFGKSKATLESINPRGGSTDLATYACD